MEEKALEGRIPTRVRFGRCVFGPSAYADGAMRYGDWSFPFPEAASACPPRRAGSCAADTDKPLKSRRSRVRGSEKGQERRGPERGTAGREEQDPEGQTPWMLGGRRTVIRRKP
jgi:hypothetical protein